MNDLPPLRFHWTVSQSEKIDAQLCRHAELCGVESILMPLDFAGVHPFEQIVSLGRQTAQLRFMAACRSPPPAPELYLKLVDEVSNELSRRILLEVDCARAPHDPELPFPRRGS